MYKGWKGIFKGCYGLLDFKEGLIFALDFCFKDCIETVSLLNEIFNIDCRFAVNCLLFEDIKRIALSFLYDFFSFQSICK